jgi:N-acetylglucosaminyldiphosphoundecaprenol N-acetyl-beta-D-mannosaminyltransferase
VNCVRVGGLNFDVVRPSEAAERVLRLRSSGGGLVVTPNLDHLRRVSSDPELHHLYGSARLTLADGMPIVWLARLAGVRLSRVTGADLLPQVCAAASASDAPITIVGTPSSTTADALRHKLSATFPGLAVSVISPPLNFELDQRQLSELGHEIARQGSPIVFLCLGSPKQERVATSLLELVPGAVFIGAGATADLYLGLFRRAPKWMQSIGLEWAFRLFQEPGRLAMRYGLDALFLVKLTTATALRR